MRLQIQRRFIRSTKRPMLILLGAFSMLQFIACNAVPRKVESISASPPQEDVFRIEVKDRETNYPLGDAQASVVFWESDSGVPKKTELKLITDANGTAVFPKVHMDRMLVGVDAKGYWSTWRWVNPRDSDRVISVRLDRWRWVVE
jgi:hypothetical protein